MTTDNTSPAHWLQLWFSRVGAATVAPEHDVQQLLSDSETERLHRFKKGHKRREYLLSRALMRHALSEQFQRPGHEWQFVEQSGAPPLIGNLPTGSYVSLSHSRGYVCFAIANCPLGIDIEVKNPQRNLLAMAEAFMTDEERASLAQNEETQEEYFYRVWCAKEACYKSLTAAQQADTSLGRIHFTSLLEGRGNRYLIEGRTSAFLFAAAMQTRPLKIRHRHFLGAMETSDDCGHFDFY